MSLKIDTNVRLASDTLLWDVLSDGRVDRSPTPAAAWVPPARSLLSRRFSPGPTELDTRPRVRAAALLGEKLLVRVAELIEGEGLFESARPRSKKEDLGDLALLRSQGLAKLLLPDHGSIEGHVVFALDGADGHREWVSINGENWPRKRLPDNVMRTIRARGDILERGGWGKSEHIRRYSQNHRLRSKGYQRAGVEIADREVDADLASKVASAHIENRGDVINVYKEHGCSEEIVKTLSDKLHLDTAADLASLTRANLFGEGEGEAFFQRPANLLILDPILRVARYLDEELAESHYSIDALLCDVSPLDFLRELKYVTSEDRQHVYQIFFGGEVSLVARAAEIQLGDGRAEGALRQSVKDRVRSVDRHIRKNRVVSMIVKAVILCGAGALVDPAWSPLLVAVGLAHDLVPDLAQRQFGLGEWEILPAFRRSFIEQAVNKYKGQTPVRTRRARGEARN